MRSRYSAFGERDADYLLYSWHPATRPDSVSFDPERVWLGLDVVSCVDGGVHDDAGVVHFRARFRHDGVEDVQEEHSHFSRVDNRWVYVGPAV